MINASNIVAVIQAAFPPALDRDVMTVMERIAGCTGTRPVPGIEPAICEGYEAAVGQFPVVVPYRVYFPESSLSDIDGLTPGQQAMYAALMTRHHSGYQREMWTRVLCRHPFEWNIPFMAFLTGDYVLEVLRAVEKGLSQDWVDLFRFSAVTNTIERTRLTQRIISYWNGNRRWPCGKLGDYPGYIAAERLGLWDCRCAPRLTRKARMGIR